MNHSERTALWFLLATIVLGRGASGCSCVPEALCPAADVDLRLVDSEEECPRGTICCPVRVDGTREEGNTASVDLFCDGECIPVDPGTPGHSADDEYDEYGTDLIDIRLASDTRCPTGYTCRSLPPAVFPVCGGTCVPRTMCTMFIVGKQNDGCTGENVCCSMDRTSWMELINDINGMELDRGSSTPSSQEDRCQWHTEADGSRIPPWLVSVWARVEVIPGITSDQFACAGVLVDSRHVLTLASCVETMDLDDLFVNVGDYDLANRSFLRMSNIYSIREKVIHEDYDSAHPMQRNAALLRLAGDARDRNCPISIASSIEDHHGYKNCLIVGWNREFLASTQTGRPGQYETRVESFNEDLFCAPGTICLGRGGTRCDDSSLTGSPVICEANKSMALKGLLVGNCTGVAVEDLAPWVKNQQTPGFVQVSKPSDSSRQYLPPL
uniref:Uncharacterized protein n=1 Tax=Anopheles atroparvus TaxID=41427 RepID=A0A182JLP9_ANOAO